MQQLAFQYFHSQAKLQKLKDEISKWKCPLVNSTMGNLEAFSIFWTVSCVTTDCSNNIVETLAGYAVLDENDGQLNLNLIIVHPNYRKMGIGKMFIQMLQSFYCKNIHVWVDMDIWDLAKFYLKIGFIPENPELHNDYIEVSKTIDQMSEAEWKLWRSKGNRQFVYDLFISLNKPV
jgi:GNAT superfamily N-acetyltransferase